MSNPSSVQRICVEVLELLFSYWVLHRRDRWTDDPTENLIETKVLALLFNDVVIRLCKFRDEDTRNLSFDQVIKELRKRPAESHLALAAESLLKNFRVITKDIESYRNEYVSHLTKRGAAHLKPPTAILEAVRVAVTIADTLSGERNVYVVEGIDLRTALRD